MCTFTSTCCVLRNWCLWPTVTLTVVTIYSSIATSTTNSRVDLVLTQEHYRENHYELWWIWWWYAWTMLWRYDIIWHAWTMLEQCLNKIIYTPLWLLIILVYSLATHETCAMVHGQLWADPLVVPFPPVPFGVSQTSFQLPPLQRMDAILVPWQ